MSVKDLKAKVYDLSQSSQMLQNDIAKLQNDIGVINQEIRRRINPQVNNIVPKKKKVKKEYK